MIELAQHIEVLLLENDCVIVPNFGGFVAHYSSAMRVEGESLFVPPTRTIGFNPQLKLNDGVLVQSYMTLYDTNFSDAVKRIDKEVSTLMATLHEDGKVDLGNIGEVRYTMRDTYEFIAYDNKITTPYLYGLDSFKMEELSVLKQPKERILVPVVLKEKKSYEIRVNRAFLRHTVAVIAAIALFFALSTPIENTYIEKDNYAQLLPADLFERIEKRSVTTIPVVVRPITVREIKVPKAEAAPAAASTTTDAAPTITDATAASNTSAPASRNYHVIVAAGVALKNAETLAAELNKQGFADAKVLHSDGKIRVSLMAFSTNEEATKELLKLRKNEAYQNAWLLAK